MAAMVPIICGTSHESFDAKQPSKFKYCVKIRILTNGVFIPEVRNQMIHIQK